MKISRILLTGDDGYNSLGTRLLIHFLKDSYSLSISATKHQQSGVGGKLSLNGPITWEEIEVDGVRGISVDGTPSDAVETAHGYFGHTFDLTISGINLGANVGGCFFSSGTIAAAARSLILQLSPKAIAFSLNVNPEHWFKKHDEREDISKYVGYPGIQAKKILNLIIEQDFWNSDFINVNFPMSPTHQIRFTRPLPDLKEFFCYPGKIDRKNHTYAHPVTLNKHKSDISTDDGAINGGHISITPCNAHLTNDEAFKKLKDISLALE